MKKIEPKTITFCMLRDDAASFKPECSKLLDLGNIQLSPMITLYNHVTTNLALYYNETSQDKLSEA